MNGSSNPLVSVIIPCHNAERWVGETLESVFRQTWPRIEVIVVDDGSTDGSREVVGRFRRGNLQLISKANGGACSARNAGYAASHGDLIQYLDADDLLSPDKIGAQVALLAAAPPRTLATCRWTRFTHAPGDRGDADQPVFRDLAPMDFLVIAASESMMHPAAWLTPRALAEEAGPWNEQLRSNPNDDGEYFSRVVLRSAGLRFSAQGRSWYRVHPPRSFSVSRLRDATSLRSRYATIELVTGRMLAAEDSDRVRRAAADYYQRYIHSVYPRVPELCRQAAARIEALGGSVLPPRMGWLGALLARVVGWRAVGWLRYWLRG